MAAPVFVADDVPTADQVNQWMVNTGFASKAVNESITASTTLQDDDDLHLAVLASSSYLLTMQLWVNGSTAGDMQFGFTTPAGTTFTGYRTGVLSAATDLNSPFIATFAGTGGSTGTVAANQPVLVEGVLVVGTTAGTVTLQWAQTAASGTLTVLAGSYLLLRRVA